ncbi:MAG: ADP-ribosylglycohydrolase family protein [Deltaproteobacteria bacterium]|nr:ADP-ribosylglycohydrolase family protein [Deltaproteobacteria bacterium]
MARARLALDGLSLGDAYGERFFAGPAAAMASEDQPPLVPAARVWRWTDDTAMAVSIVEELAARGAIDPGSLAARFGARYLIEPDRGYGGTAHEILHQLAHGRPWAAAASEPFDGAGSMGNGGAMRAAPVGAYFAGDLDRVVAEARASAAPTHANPEGQAGAIAVAVAAAVAVEMAAGLRPRTSAELLAAVIAATPPGATRDGLVRATELADRGPRAAAYVLGCGRKVISSDTVPFALWSASHHLDDYPTAVWRTVVALGDMDTTAAIVGGVVALAVGRDGLPADWLARREPLPV